MLCLSLHINKIKARVNNHTHDPCLLLLWTTKKICGALLSLLYVILNITENVLYYTLDTLFIHTTTNAIIVIFHLLFPSSYDVSAIELFVQVFTFLLLLAAFTLSLQMCKCRRYWWWNCMSARVPVIQCWLSLIGNRVLLSVCLCRLFPLFRSLR